MGTCKICGKNFGLMGGGSEPYTGHNLQVCNSCGEVLKKIDKVKNEDTQEVKDLFVSVMSMTDDADVKQILSAAPASSDVRVTRYNDEYYVESWVDAENSFGATIRTNFEVTLRKNGRSFEVESSRIY